MQLGSTPRTFAISDLNFSTQQNMASKKRKPSVLEAPTSPPKKVKISSSHDDLEVQIKARADAIVQDSQAYNKIPKLLKFARGEDRDQHTSTSALCRVFSSLWLQGRMKRTQAQNDESKQVTEWLLERYAEYKTMLLQRITGDDPSTAQMSQTLFMRLVQAEVESNPEVIGSMWQRGSLYDLVKTFLAEESTLVPGYSFVKSYAARYEDVQLIFLRAIAKLSEQGSTEAAPKTVGKAISLLSMLGEILRQSDTEKGGTSLLLSKKRLHKKDEIRKRTGEAWLMLMRQPLTRENRRQLLGLVSSQIEPSLPNPELLLDFLTDCCDSGGSEAVMALDGLYGLITQHGLDYPLLYHKLYALLDTESLHKKHRSRFLRLVNTFLASTHLPAVLVASFIKRLSRLSLFGPPAAVVAIAPLIYNLMQNHPACTPMLHRRLRNSTDQDTSEHFSDPFNAEEPDPNMTGAIDSSVWELDTLRNHWHPNVATIAKILAEQFLKQSYNLEDFLDHSYGRLLDTEVTKAIVKPPPLEYQIPKRIFTRDHEHDHEQGILTKVWQFS